MERRTGHPVDNHLLFLNIDLPPAQKEKLREAILTDSSPPHRIQVQVVGAAELAGFLNDHPHLRSAWFEVSYFKCWDQADRDHRHKKFRPQVDLTGREDLLNRVRALIEDPEIHAVILTGPHDIGKTRLALEATAHRPQDVVVAAAPAPCLRWITGRRFDFELEDWIIAQAGGNPGVLLAEGIAYPGEVITGPESDHFALCGNKVEQVLNDPETPGVARAFLRELADGFKDVSTRKAIWEYDEEINGLRS